MVRELKFRGEIQYSTQVSRYRVYGAWHRLHREHGVIGFDLALDGAIAACRISVQCAVLSVSTLKDD
eukprot:2627778-Rhodomonas_salina.1